MKDLYRVVYTSFNLLEGTESERAAMVAEILATSQRNNGKVGVTGALLFNGGCFAQVLEGPQKAVETTFERIQRDPRHSEVNVLQCEAVEARGFSNWSMAFIGQSVAGRALWNEIAGRTGFDYSRIEGDELFAVLQAIVLEEEGIQTQAKPPVQPAAVTSSPLLKAASGKDLDVERVRAELLERVPDRGPAAVTGAPGAPSNRPPMGSDAVSGSIEGVVLRAALAEERARTTELRRSLDDGRIELAAARDELETLRRHRDFWAERAKALALAFCQEPASTNRIVGDNQHGEVLPALRATA